MWTTADTRMTLDILKVRVRTDSMAVAMRLGSEREGTERAEMDTDEPAGFRIPTRISSRRKEISGSRMSMTPMRETTSATDADQKNGGETEGKQRRTNFLEVPAQEGCDSS